MDRRKDYSSFQDTYPSQGESYANMDLNPNHFADLKNSLMTFLGAQREKEFAVTNISLAGRDGGAGDYSDGQLSYSQVSGSQDNSSTDSIKSSSSHGTESDPDLYSEDFLLSKENTEMQKPSMISFDDEDDDDADLNMKPGLRSAHAFTSNVLVEHPVEDGLEQTQQIEKQYSKLHNLCFLGDVGKDNSSWDLVIDAFVGKSKEEAKGMVEEVEHETIPLFLACERQPPVRVIKVLVEASPDTLFFADVKKCRALHIACSYNASEDVIRYLIESDTNPVASLECVNSDSQTPLHLMIYKYYPSFPPVGLFEILSTPVTMELRDDLGNTPFSLFSEYLKKVHSLDQVNRSLAREHCKKILQIYFDSRPSGHSDILNELYNFPSWLHNYALEHPHVQRILNYRMAQKPVTFLLMMNYFIQLIIIVCYTDVMSQALWKSNPQIANILFLSIGTLLLIIQTLVRVSSSFRFRPFYMDLWELLDILQIIFLIISVDLLQKRTFVNISNTNSGVLSFTAGLVWFILISLLRKTYLPFTLFVRGVVHVRMMFYLLSRFE